jgi:hypothetical protein
MSVGHRPFRKLDGPPKYEWLFSDRNLLPDDQAVAAYYWEFGLETPSVIEEVHRLRIQEKRYNERDVAAERKWIAANPIPDVLATIDTHRRWRERFLAANPDSDSITKFRCYGANFLSHWHKFPSQHWLELPEETRNGNEPLPPPRDEVDDWGDTVKRNEKYGAFGTYPMVFFKTLYGFGCHTELTDFNIKMASLFKYVPTKGSSGLAAEDRWTEYRLFHFSWARSDRKLKADFAKWLKENRPADRPAYHVSQKSDSRRTTKRDLLKGLGAYRLLRHFNGDWNAAADYSARFLKDKRGNPKALYVEQSEWRDAEKRALQALTEFFKKVFG